MAIEIEFCGSKQRMHSKVSYFRDVKALKRISNLLAKVRVFGVKVSFQNKKLVETRPRGAELSISNFPQNPEEGLPVLLKGIHSKF